MSESINYKNHTITIDYDYHAENPRNWDSLGTMICFHNQYNLGDSHSFDHNDYNDWDEMERAIGKEFDAIVLPIYMYEHSGITISTSPFSCPWDSGQVGFIGISKSKIRQEYGVKRINKALLERIEKYLIAEIETYSKYVNGEWYYMQILNTDNEVVESCGGYFDLEEAIAAAKSQVDFIDQNTVKQLEFEFEY